MVQWVKLLGIPTSYIGLLNSRLAGAGTPRGQPAAFCTDLLLGGGGMLMGAWQCSLAGSLEDGPSGDMQGPGSCSGRQSKPGDFLTCLVLGGVSAGEGRALS